MIRQKFVCISSAMLAVAILAVSFAPIHAATIAHWSFDSPTLTVDSGNITSVADATGNHNATPGTGGTGGTGNQFVSAAFDAATSSVAGRFNEALRFNGDNFLLFDNLTELMAANGAPSYSVSMWINTTAALSSAHPFATLANWGNEPAATGPTRFTYAFGPSGPGTAGNSTLMRGQTRFENLSSGGGGTNGTDIFGRSATAPTQVNNGEWHMLSWTFDTTTGALRSYFDGALVDSFTSTATEFALANSSSAVGGIGIKADNGIFLPQDVLLDEIWVFTDALSDGAIVSLYRTNAIPEPAAAMLMACGVLAAATLRRKR